MQTQRSSCAVTTRHQLFDGAIAGSEPAPPLSNWIKSICPRWTAWMVSCANHYAAVAMYEQLSGLSDAECTSRAIARNLGARCARGIERQCKKLSQRSRTVHQGESEALRLMQIHQKEKIMARTWFATTLTALLLAASGTIASATEIKLFCPVAMKGVMPDIVSQFETSGQKVLIEYGTVGALAGQLLKDAPADVAILSGPRIEELEKQGKIVAGSRADVARVGVGVFVRAGAAKP